MKTKLKEINEYILRIIIFLLLHRKCTISLLLTILNLNKIVNSEELIVIIVLAWLIYLYLSIKVCGLFKKLNKLNFLNALLVIFLVNLVFNYSLSLTIQFTPFKVSYVSGTFLYLIVYYFIFYRILNFLGKKFPNTCGKIGYYSSLEFYKDLFKKIKSGIKNKGEV